MSDFRSSLAIDLDDIDQVIDATIPTKVFGQRVLWDLDGDYYFDDARFVCPTNAIYNFTGNFLLTNLSNVKRAKLHLFQRGALWATICDLYVPAGETEIGLYAACQCDGIYDENDYFEVFVELVPIDAEASVTGSVSGDRERTFFGFDLTNEVELDEVDSED